MLVYACFVNACTKCVYDVLECILGSLSFVGVIDVFCKVSRSYWESRLVASWNLGPVYTTVEKSTGHVKKGVSQL